MNTPTIWTPTQLIKHARQISCGLSDCHRMWEGDR